MNAATYYVATTGNDSNSGSSSSPFLTVQRGVNAASAGDTVYLRGGTYNQTVSISKSGSSGSPITISGYPGETAIIDGQKTIPADSNTALFYVWANYVTLQDLTIQNSHAAGLYLFGNNNQALRVKSYRNYGSGIMVSAGGYSLVSDCEVYYNSTINEFGYTPTGYWGAGLTVARNSVHHATVRRNKVWNNWGEGLSTFESSYTTAEDNIVWDNWSTNLYISDTTYSIFRRNLVYMSSNSAIAAYGGAKFGLLMGDEVSTSSNNTVINNFVLGGDRAFSCCSGATNNFIANNTFANGWTASVQIWDGGVYTNSQFLNNVVLQDSSAPVAYFGSTVTGMTKGNNMWSKTPPSAASGSGDIIADPQLRRTGTNTAGNLTAEWFKLLSGSPAATKARSVAAVTEDFFKTARGSTPDIGGHQLTGTSGSDTTAPLAPAGLTATAASSSQINLAWNASTDNVAVAGYRVYRGGVQVASVTGTTYSDTGLNASTSYSYAVAAFDAAGNLSSLSAAVTATTKSAADTTAPSVPTGLTATPVSSSQITLTWNVSTDNVGVAGYRVYRNGTQIASVTTTSYSSTGLSASTTYSYTVAAYDAAGNTSAQSAAVSATTSAAGDTTAPSVPTGLTATPVSSSQINLAWSASTDNVAVAGYKVYRNGTQIANVTGTAYSNTGLSASTTYAYTVAAYDAAGNTSAQSARVSATTPSATTSVATYYVAPGGNDANAGSPLAPFATLNKAVSVASAGDTVYLRGGTYVQMASITNSGTSAKPITISGYPGETAIIDGQLSQPTDQNSALISVKADYITLQDLTVQNSNGVGVNIAGNGNQALRLKVQKSFGTGIFVTGGGNNVVANCEVYYNSRYNEFGKQAGWATGLAVGRNGVHHTAVRGNKVWNNWGEGLSTFESQYSTIEDNTVYDNWANNLYVSDSQYTLVQRNLVYQTAQSPVSGSGGAQVGIILTDLTAVSSDNQIVNNFVRNNDGRYAFSMGGGAANDLIANNTFAGGLTATVKNYAGGTTTNARFMNNIVLQESTAAIGETLISAIYSNNLWSKTPPTGGSGSGDIVANPQLSKSGTTAAGSLSGNWFKLLSTSPAITKAQSLAQVTEDYFRTARNSTPDIGGHQYGGTVSGDTTAPSTPTGLTVTAASSTQINLSWNAATDNVGVAGYRVYRNGALVTSVAGTSYSDSGLAAGTSYTYTVAAYDAAGNASTQSTAVTETTLASTDLTISATTDYPSSNLPANTIVTLTAQASGGSGPLDMVWTVNGVALPTTVTTANGITTGQATWTSGPSKSMYVLTATATDASGATASARMKVRVR